MNRVEQVTSNLATGRESWVLSHDRLNLGSALRSSHNRVQLRNPVRLHGRGWASSLNMLSDLLYLAVFEVACQKKTSFGSTRSKSERFSETLENGVVETF